MLAATDVQGLSAGRFVRLWASDPANPAHEVEMLRADHTSLFEPLVVFRASTNISWAAANLNCAQEGGQLTSIHNKYLNEEPICGEAGCAGRVWIGLASSSTGAWYASICSAHVSWICHNI